MGQPNLNYSDGYKPITEEPPVSRAGSYSFSKPTKRLPSPEPNTRDDILPAKNSPFPPVPVPSPPTPPPPRELKTSDIEVHQPQGVTRAFLGAIAISTILASLFLAYFNSAKATQANQLEAKYQNEVVPIIDGEEFKQKEQAVIDIGRQSTQLQQQKNNVLRYSALLSELESIIFKGVRLTRITASTESKIILEGVTSSFADLARVTDSVRTSVYFTGVSVVSANKQQNGNVNFIVTFTVDESFLKTKR
ncbi:MAG TPA: PilN domain-containing protein [bacterium]|nr:PilN domain-containing protein [bacterium]